MYNDDRTKGSLNGAKQYAGCLHHSNILASTVGPLFLPQHITYINPYPTAFPYGNGMVLHFYQQQESSTTKTVNKVINKGLKAYV